MNLAIPGSNKFIRDRLVILFLMLGAAFLLAACGGSGDSDIVEITVSAKEGASLTTKSGDLTLEIPAGALGEDVDIRIELVQSDDLPEHILKAVGQGPAWRLEPSGLQFSEPAIVTLRLDPSEIDDGINAYFLDVIGDDGVQEALEGVKTFIRTDGSVEVSGQLSHFSWLKKTDAGLGAALEQIEPRKQPFTSFFDERKIGAFRASYRVTFEIPQDDPDFLLTLTDAHIDSTGAVKISSAEDLMKKGTNDYIFHSLLKGWVDFSFREFSIDVEYRVYPDGEIRAYKKPREPWGVHKGCAKC